MKLFIKIKYDGSSYSGYQVQKGTPTIQQALNEATAKLFGTECDITGCSRTDAGVHALCFCATVERRGTTGLETSIPVEKIPYALNTLLPDDISVFYAEWKDDDFHARYSVAGKTYIYRIYNSPFRDPFEEKRSMHYPRPLSENAVVDMNDGAKLFCGKHDFTSFMATGSKICDPVRTVRYASVIKEGNIIVFRVSADGFLYNMVRIMAGTLLDVAVGKMRPEDIVPIIEAKDRKKAGTTLPPWGLYLEKVDYE